MNSEEKIALFWLAEESLPKEIKCLISQEFWEEEKRVKKSKEEYFYLLFDANGRRGLEQITITPKIMQWWGIKDHNELPEVYRMWEKKPHGTYISVSKWYNPDMLQMEIYIRGNQERVPYSRNNDHSLEVWGGPPRSILKIVPRQGRNWFH